MRMNRRRFLTLAAATLSGPALGAGPQVITVTDMAGRTVELAAPPQRIVLLEARDILTMSMLHPDPARLVVGWAAVERMDSDDLHSAYSTGFDIALVGRQTPETVSLEGLISLQPDLVVATAYMAPGNGADALSERLAELGIPVLFSSSFSNDAAGEAPSPLAELPRLMHMWGAILDRRREAAAFRTFHEQKIERLKRRLAGVAPRKTYFEIGSLYDDCCWAVGRDIWGTLLEAAGGRGLDAASSPWAAKIQLEQLLAEGADVYIATGGGYANATRPAIGPGLPEAEARAGLERLTGRPGFHLLKAVEHKQVHGIWTGLITAQPLNLLFLEVAAKWLHPDRCHDIDPHETLAELNRRFLARPIAGPCWVSL